jgi:hypothetical protein
MNAGVDTGRAEIVVATVTDTAVEVLVIHGVVAVVAVYDPGSAGSRLGTESEGDIVGSLGELVEEGWRWSQHTAYFDLC